MITNQARFDQAIASFDALNAQDPNQEIAGSVAHPKELLYAQRMSAMLQRYAPDASEVLQLAARCQHVQRWTISRASYAMTKAGYHQWRNALKSFHAGVAQKLLSEAGYDASAVSRVCALVGKTLPMTDAEAQVLEDVIVLVFLESYLEPFVAAHGDYDEAKFVDILNKTFRKISPEARAALLDFLDLPSALRPLIKHLLEQKNAS